MIWEKSTKPTRFCTRGYSNKYLSCCYSLCNQVIEQLIELLVPFISKISFYILCWYTKKYITIISHPLHFLLISAFGWKELTHKNTICIHVDLHFSVALSVASFLCNNFLSCTVCKKRNFCKDTSFIWRKYFLCCYNTGIGFSLFVWIMQVLPLETYNDFARKTIYLQLLCLNIWWLRSIR